ncbi:hypothetical protein EES43_10130 [Streptomyces sp. ADI96-02]|uniref:hypothetical protein n=1 Tax=Streptomyces sp. ADI96-02 TaxID=1522760 RepID=UPI000F551F10|nr:hypothetical protein [Streptomyces sp. ADI96-02]RPK64390.1 hypothetical protein EES43_10130 [Streptomyces sp. ADI96-02]
MPRPTAAQFAYGSATVIVSALALLLLSGAASDVAVAAVCTAALALGLLVAAVLPAPRPVRPAALAHRAPDGPAPRRVPAARTSERTEEHSLRR